ncbi:L-ascorbate oxidase [Lecanosticta acicola]|uniref:L-ascorbate oxidase n=1 Tax=Lecanosticta acicola TaxID=111012 RepID=A0AAI9E8T6_9PEZI|nr:L-ascorbate oxidase [Lecanosticta acicola]
MVVTTRAALAVLAAAAAATQVLAWGPREGPHGAPGHYGGLRVHDETFQPDFSLHVTYENITVGCQSRASVLVNGTLPGPELRLPAGKTSWVRVYNDMGGDHCYNTTMHWHGLSQRMAPFADGTPQASQWPIPCQHFFDYEVHPTEDEPGTYFYHSHVGFQAVSASGPLIVEDCKPLPYQYDEEQVILLSDYFNATDHAIETDLLSTPFVWPGEVNAVLINGVGVADGEQAGDGSCKLPVINVSPGKTYRLRFIGGAALSMVQLGIVGHDEFTIIEADGAYTKPHTEKFMQVSTGQRFSALFKAKSQAELGNQTDYLIQFETKDRPAVYRGYGVLRYRPDEPSITTAPAKPPLTLSNATYDWAEYALEPLYENNFPTADQVTRRIEIDSRQLTEQTIIWHLNGLQWNETTVPYPGDLPYLVAIYEHGPSAIPNYTAALANNGWDPYTKTFPAKMGEVLEIILYNTGSLVKNGGAVDYHPFHAHGGHYYDIGSGNGTYNATANEMKLKDYHPVKRDTTNLYRYGSKTVSGERMGWRAWRLRVDDAGVWMIHCHILQHMIMGMQSVWVMGDYEDITALPAVDASGYFTFGGSVVGNATHPAVMPHYFGDDGK